VTFKKIQIKNFRNFDDISVKLGNKNVFFGMNDIGKTNFLSAIRYLFDREMRRRDIIDSDYFKRNTTKPIEVMVAIDITKNNDDTKKLRAKLKGAIGSNDTTLYIKLTADYNEQENRADIRIFWGGNENKLYEIKVSSGGYFDLDAVFQVYYINSYLDLHNLFKKNINTLVKKDEASKDADKEAETAIEAKVSEINKEISKLSGVKSFEGKLTPSYKKMRDEDISITIKSDFAINYLYSNIVPYIHKDGETDEYPTQGEGRKKLVAYSVYNILAENTADKKINLFLIEEPETHLHRSMQSALSHFLFNAEANDNTLNYLFISTHSPFILSEMDDVNLSRIYNSDKISSGSGFYEVPDEWNSVKKKLNRALSEAIFADSVLLVEGESEGLLFERVLSEVDPFYESKGVYIISVEGVGFKPYIKLLMELGIKCVSKTDNDITRKAQTKEDKAASKPIEYQTLGFSRVNDLVELIEGEDKNFLTTETSLAKADATIDARRKRYCANKKILDDIREAYNIHLSYCGFEEDLHECLGEERLVALIGKNPIKVLKTSKHHKMVILASKLTKEDCTKIFNHYNFACLKAVLDCE
jgi:putative ATP-dependent endonuclease of OLD family